MLIGRGKKPSLVSGEPADFGKWGRVELIKNDRRWQHGKKHLQLRHKIIDRVHIYSMSAKSQVLIFLQGIRHQLPLLRQRQIPFAKKKKNDRDILEARPNGFGCCQTWKTWLKIWLWVKKGYPKNLLVKGNIDQNLWSLGVFFLTRSHLDTKNPRIPFSRWMA